MMVFIGDHRIHRRGDRSRVGGMNNCIYHLVGADSYSSYRMWAHKIASHRYCIAENEYRHQRILVAIDSLPNTSAPRIRHNFESRLVNRCPD